MDALAMLALLLVAGYVVACAVWPFTGCRRCEGTGKRRSPSGRAWRSCGRCTGTGTGSRVRAGRWLFEVLRARDGGPGTG